MVDIVNNNNTHYISVSAIQWLIDGARRLEINLDEVLQDCGLNFRMADLDAGKVSNLSTEAYCRLYYRLNYLLQIKAFESIGRRGITPDEFKLMCYCIITAETLGEVISRLHDFFGMMRERLDGVLSLRDAGGDVQFCLDFGWGSEDDPIKIEIVKKSLFLFFYLFSWLIGRPLSLQSVHIKYNEDVDYVRLCKMFCCNVQVNQLLCSFSFSRNDLQSPTIRSYRELKLFFDEYPGKLMLPVSCVGNVMADQLEQFMISQCLRCRRFPSFSELAEYYNTSESSLSRKLKAENRTYSVLKEQCQFSLAKDYMWRIELSIADIAALIGFSDANSFSRSFSRWAGIPPSAFRKKMLLEKS